MRLAMPTEQLEYRPLSLVYGVEAVRWFGWANVWLAVALTADRTKAMGVALAGRADDARAAEAKATAEVNAKARRLRDGEARANRCVASIPPPS